MNFATLLLLLSLISLAVGFVAGFTVASVARDRDVARISMEAGRMQRELAHRRSAQLSGAYPVDRGDGDVWYERPER